MPHDPSPNAITIENTELYFTDVFKIAFFKNDNESHQFNFNGISNKIQLRHLVNWIVSENYEDWLIKVYFNDNHKFNQIYPTLGRYETTLKGLKYLIENYPNKYYPPLNKTADLDNPTTPLID
jgi:hypothetical protein